MGQVQLVLVIHNHQPVGNFDAVFREVTERAYLPFLRVAADYPLVRFGLHTSGCLLEWMEQHDGEYLELVRAMVASGQVELLGGGMYEPILPVLPRRDALWQLSRMNEYVGQLFGVVPRGMWCPERVWEPHLPEVIAAAGLNYTLLDDFHFRSAADARDVETQYFRTSHAGHAVNLLPISQKLRYTMPFQPVPETIDYLRQLGESSNTPPLVVFGDDGEKFGNWPDTYEWVYEKGWLKSFFSALADAGDWLDVLTPSEAIARRQPAGNVFIPALSYAEMGEWTRLDPDAGEDDPPGHWRNFLRKYPESKQQLDRAVHISNLLASPAAESLPAEVAATARTQLGQAECNCAYWHGVFGGIYLNYLRHALHSHGIQAEAALHKALHGTSATVTPFPAGSELTDQFLLADAAIAAVVDAGQGLCLSRLDSREAAFCWTNVLTRRRENYHSKLLAHSGDQADEHASIHDRVVIKEEGLSDLLEFDSHQRVSFNIRGHSRELGPATPPEKAAAALRSSEIFDDWHAAAEDIMQDHNGIAARVSSGGCEISKSVSLAAGALNLDANVSVLPGANQPALLSVELNLTMLTDSASDRWIEVAGQKFALSAPQLIMGQPTLSMCDGWQGRRLRIASSDVHSIFIYPVYTASSSEGGFERTYQGSCIMLLFSYHGSGRKISLSLSLDKLTDEH